MMSAMDRYEHSFDYGSLTMQSNLVDNHIRYEFRSILKLLIHFSFSIIQLISILAILGLQIALTVTQTCEYHIAVGFWSFPFLSIAPFSIWIVIWRRSSTACFIAILIHFCSTLFATAIIIISFLVLIGQIECSTSSLNMYYVALNSSLISVAALFKLFNYIEIILLYRLLRTTNQTSTIFIKDFYKRNYPLIADTKNINIYRPRSKISDAAHSDLDYLFV